MTKHTILQLPPDERSELERLVSSGNAPARVQTRARILLLTDHSQEAPHTQSQTASALLCAPATVSNILRRYHQEGLHSALSEKPRPGNPRKLDGHAEAHLIVLALSEAPEGFARWTVRLLADRMVELGFVESLSYTTVAQTLKKTRSNPGVSRRGASASLRRST